MALQAELKADQRALQDVRDSLGVEGSVSRTLVSQAGRVVEVDLVPIPLATDRKIRDAVEAEMLVIAIEQPRGLILVDELRNLRAQIRKQLTLEVSQATDRRFLGHLEHALGDLALDAAGLR